MKLLQKLRGDIRKIKTVKEYLLLRQESSSTLLKYGNNNPKIVRVYNRKN